MSWCVCVCVRRSCVISTGETRVAPARPGTECRVHVNRAGVSMVCAVRGQCDVRLFRNGVQEQGWLIPGAPQSSFSGKKKSVMYASRCQLHKSGGLACTAAPQLPIPLHHVPLTPAAHSCTLRTCHMSCLPGKGLTFPQPTNHRRLKPGAPHPLLPLHRWTHRCPAPPPPVRQPLQRSCPNSQHHVLSVRSSCVCVCPSCALLPRVAHRLPPPTATPPAQPLSAWTPPCCCEA